MAQKFYNLEQAAEVLGVAPGEVNRMRERNELHAYRDGSDWKFKTEEVEQKARDLRASGPAKPEGAEEDTDDVLLSEVELGESDSGASGTVIGPAGQSPADSDIQLAGSDVKLGGSDLQLAGSDDAKVEMDAEVSGFDELEMTLDDDLTLEDSQVSLSEEAGGAEGSDITADSALDLSAKGEGLDDDDLVLGGSGSGSDITIGQDSGISLVDPRDSGLSLDEPMDLVGGGEDSLELGEDDMLTFSEESDTESPTELKTDDDFLLTPLEEGSDEADSESGSQVIALEPEGVGDEAATMVASTAAPSMAAMLDEDLGGVGMEAGAVAAGPAQAPQGFADGAALAQSTAALPEAPYSVWVVLSLALCVVFLILTGMMSYDLLRNMWSWNTPYDINSSIMDTVLSWFEG